MLEFGSKCLFWKRQTLPIVRVAGEREFSRDRMGSKLKWYTGTAEYSILY
jgi:hypothetical protein